MTRSFIMLSVQSFYDGTRTCWLSTWTKAGRTRRRISYDYCMELLQWLSQLGHIKYRLDVDDKLYKAESYTLWH